MEQVSFKLHSRMSSSIVRRTSYRSRLILEQSLLFVAVTTFCVVNISHVAFCRRKGWDSIPRRCLRSFPSFHSDWEVLSVRVIGEEKALFSYSSTKGYLYLDEETRSRLGVSEEILSVSPRSPVCFGDALLRRLIVPYVDSEAIALNWLAGAMEERGGWVYHIPSGRMLSLETPKPSYCLVKLGAVLTSLFLFFVTTTLVRFTLLQTQANMLRFAVSLHYSVTNQRPFAKLILSHVLHSCVFIPIMLGTQFFLGYYFHDNVLAFFVLTIVWMCEVYKVLSMRTLLTQYFFPKAFFLYFSLFHFYFFLHPFGFHYWTLASFIFFLIHSMWFFYIRYELPALQNGSISSTHPRSHPQHTFTPIHSTTPLTQHHYSHYLYLHSQDPTH